MELLQDREVVSVRALQIADRCDRCMAQAYMLAHRGELELLFCAHHGRENFDSLTEQGFYIDDQSSILRDEELDRASSTVLD